MAVFNSQLNLSVNKFQVAIHTILKQSKTYAGGVYKVRHARGGGGPEKM